MRFARSRRSADVDRHSCVDRSANAAASKRDRQAIDNRSTSDRHENDIVVAAFGRSQRVLASAHGDSGHAPRTALRCGRACSAGV
ncbi:MAG: hypothetical protein JF600_14780 [Xanthomonadales bacterium]|nr:hypothetical protein [Xanthomonadales bacterium]